MFFLLMPDAHLLCAHWRRIYVLSQESFDCSIYIYMGLGASGFRVSGFMASGFRASGYRVLGLWFFQV